MTVIAFLFGIAFGAMLLRLVQMELRGWDDRIWCPNCDAVQGQDHAPWCDVG